MTLTVQSPLSVDRRVQNRKPSATHPSTSKWQGPSRKMEQFGAIAIRAELLVLFGKQSQKCDTTNTAAAMRKALQVCSHGGTITTAARVVQGDRPLAIKNSQYPVAQVTSWTWFYLPKSTVSLGTGWPLSAQPSIVNSNRVRATRSLTGAGWPRILPEHARGFWICKLLLSNYRNFELQAREANHKSTKSLTATTLCRPPREFRRPKIWTPRYYDPAETPTA